MLRSLGQQSRWQTIGLSFFVTAVLLAVGLWNVPFSAAQSSGISFGYGSGVQVVDPDGLNRAPIWVTQPGTTVDFALHPLAPAEFIQRFAADPYQEPAPATAPVLSWQQTFSGDTNDPYGAQAVELPAGAPSGLYILHASHSQAGQASSYLLITRHTLLAKRAAGGQALVWATRLQDHAPTPGMEVTIYDAQANLLAQQQTDANGVAKFDLAAATPFLAVARSGAEMTLVGFDWQWSGNSSGGSYWWWGDTLGGPYRAFIHTDRPIYRPGDTIHFQAFVRRSDHGELGLVTASTAMTATLHDSRNNLVAVLPVINDEFGALHGDFSLSDAPPLGWYSVQLAVDDQTFRQALRVEEYRKPEYQVKITPSVSHSISGNPVQITVQADYFFGQPVVGAQVKLTVQRQNYWRNWQWWLWNDGSWSGNSPIAEFSGVTDGAGRWSLEYTPESSAAWDALYTFSASVTDQRNTPISASTTLPVYWAGLAVEIDLSRYGYEVGQSVLATVSALDHAGAPLAGQPMTVQLFKDSYGEVQDQPLPPQQVVSGPDGRSQVAFNGLAQGWYRIAASATDASGRQAVANSYLWVFDPASSSWWFSSADQLSILPDKESYVAGDTAHLLIQSSVTSVALLTLEREEVLAEQIVTINGPVTQVDIAIDDKFAPNIYARLHLFQPTAADASDQRAEGQLLMAQTELIVPAEQQRLDVTIASDAAEYAPGAPAQISLQVKNAQGQGVVARVALALVDEAIFALQPDLSADLFETFYGRRPNQVNTYHTLARRPVYWTFSSPEPLATPPSEAVDTDKFSGQFSTELRQRFEDTAYWNATITTDGSGQAQLTVPLPDNLTTWRIVAYAISADTKVGEATGSLLVTKDVIARAITPRFAVVGDRFQVRVTGSNYTGQDTTGAATVDASSLVLLDDGPRGLTLPDGVSATADWTAVAALPGAGVVTASVQTAAGSDALLQPLPIRPFSALDRWHAAGQANLSASETFTFPLNAVPTESSLTVRLAPSFALGVLDGLDELIDYPYGCVEQTMSRMLPGAVAAVAYADLGLPNPKQAELSQVFAAGVQKIVGFQYEDGSWGWFYDDNGNMYMTAYVLYGLTMVQRTGFQVDHKVVDRGFAALDSALPKSDDPAAQAFALYVKALAGRGDLPLAQTLLGRTSEMDSASLALLALALQQDGDSAGAQTALNLLIERAVETPESAHWPLSSEARDWRWWQRMPSVEKNTAAAVQAIATLRPDHSLLPKAVRWLMEHRRGAGWSNTQSTAFAVMGLVQTIVARDELQANYAYTVKLNGVNLSAGQMTPQNVTAPVAPIVIAGDTLRAGENTLTVERSAGPGALYYSALLQQQLYYDAFTPLQSADDGLKLTRSYHLVEGAARADGAFNVGDLVEVQLALETTGELGYVLVEDPLPAGFEGVNERLNPRMYGDPFFWECTWQCWGYNQKNVRDDRVEFFITQLMPGAHTLTYLMRATTPGEFGVAPAQAYPMYNDAIWGRSASQRVRVAPEQLAGSPALAGDLDRSCQITAMDTRLSANAWGSNTPSADIVPDGAVTLRDVAYTAAREQATCAADRPGPGGGNGQALMRLTAPANQVMTGDLVTVDVMLDPGPTGVAGIDGMVGGIGIGVQFDSIHMRLVDVQWHGNTGSVLPLGPRIDTQKGIVLVGAFGLPTTLPVNAPLFSLIFQATGVGSAKIALTSAEAVDDAGRSISAQANGGGATVVNGQTFYLPLIGGR